MAMYFLLELSAPLPIVEAVDLNVPWRHGDGLEISAGFRHIRLSTSWFNDLLIITRNGEYYCYDNYDFVKLLF